jgi:hypothetical protein
MNIEKVIDQLVEAGSGSSANHETDSGYWTIIRGGAAIRFDNSGYVQTFTKPEWARLMAGKVVRDFTRIAPGIIATADEEHHFNAEEVAQAWS